MSWATDAAAPGRQPTPGPAPSLGGVSVQHAQLLGSSASGSEDDEDARLLRQAQQAVLGAQRLAEQVRVPPTAAGQGSGAAAAPRVSSAAAAAVGKSAKGSQGAAGRGGACGKRAAEVDEPGTAAAPPAKRQRAPAAKKASGVAAPLPDAPAEAAQPTAPPLVAGKAASTGDPAGGETAFTAGALLPAAAQAGSGERDAVRVAGAPYPAAAGVAAHSQPAAVPRQDVAGTDLSAAVEAGDEGDDDAELLAEVAAAEMAMRQALAHARS